MSFSNDFFIDDIVICKLKHGLIVPNTENDFDDKVSFKIIGAKLNEWEMDEFVVYIPEYELGRVKSNLIVSRHLCKEYDIEQRFIGERMTFIRTSHIFGVERKADGERCQNCNEYFDWAEAGPNGVFICGSCRLNPWR